jgi:hypothetical protein
MAQIPSVIAADVTVVGTLASSGDVTVEGSCAAASKEMFRPTR